MDSTPASDQPSGEIIPIRSARQEQGLSLQALYETRGESALVDDIFFAGRYLTALRSRFVAEVGVVQFILNDLHTPEDHQNVAILFQNHRGKHLREIANEEAYAALPLEDPLEELFQQAANKLQGLPQKDALDILRRLHLLTMVDPNVNEMPDRYIKIHVQTLLDSADTGPDNIA